VSLYSCLLYFILFYRYLGKTANFCTKGQKKIPEATEQKSTEAEKGHKECKRKGKAKNKTKKEQFSD